jgi:hypothetical protein
VNLVLAQVRVIYWQSWRNLLLGKDLFHGVDDRIEETEISNFERAKMAVTDFQQMEHEVGIVMQQIFFLGKC